MRPALAASIAAITGAHAGVTLSLVKFLLKNLTLGCRQRLLAAHCRRFATARAAMASANLGLKHGRQDHPAGSTSHRSQRAAGRAADTQGLAAMGRRRIAGRYRTAVVAAAPDAGPGARRLRPCRTERGRRPGSQFGPRCL